MFCIYKITCTSNNKFYIGSTKKFNIRKGQHLSNLRYGRHHNYYLQNIFNKHREDSLQFSIIEECKESDLQNREQYYIDLCWGNPLCVNLLKSSTIGDTLSNHPRKKEIIKKRSATKARRFAKMTTEERKQKYCRYGKQNGSYGKPITEKKREDGRKHGKKSGNIMKKRMEGKTFEEIYGKHKAEGIKSKLSKTMSDIQSGEKNNFYNKAHTDETKDFLRQRMLGNYGINKTAKPLNINGKMYLSLKHASTELGIPIPTVAYRVKSKNFGNYQYM